MLQRNYSNKECRASFSKFLHTICKRTCLFQFVATRVYENVPDCSNAEVELRNRAITILSAAAQHLKSGPIALLTMKMAADPFAKVKGLIQGLIERLLTEAASEATHKVLEGARSDLGTSSTKLNF